MISGLAVREGGGEGFLGFGTHAEIGVGFRKEDAAIAADDVGCRDGETPAWFAVDERDVDEDGEVVGAVVLGDSVDEAEFFGDRAAGVSEHGERQTVLDGHEVALALDLRANCNHQDSPLAECAVEIAPRFEFSNAIGTPAAAKEFDDQRPKGEQVGAADQAAGGVLEGEVRGERADGENFLLDTGSEELLDGAFADGQTLGLHQVAGVGGDLVELVLKVNHLSYSRRLKLS